MEVLESPPGDIPSQPATDGGNTHEPGPRAVPGRPKAEGGLVQTEEATGTVTPTPPTPSEGDVSKATDELADENHAEAASSLEQADAEEEKLTAEAYENSELNPNINGSDSSVSTSRRSSVSLAESALETLEDDEDEKKANELFTKKHGVLYVPDKFFAKMSSWARHCHIYVSANDGGNPLEGQKKTAVSASQDALPHAIPPRMTIINQRLIRDLGESGFTLDSIFNFHLAPYRILVYYESEIKARHQRLEEEFALLSLEHPDHGAILRKEEFLHPRHAFKVKNFDVSPAYHEHDDVDMARTLLDGYRALTQFFDTDLRGLVENCRKIRAISVEALPFSHLWFLFALHRTTPIIAGDQAYRVLQIRGGRATTSDGKHADESYDSQGASKTRWTMSNLEIHCFFIDFDGKEFGPVIHKIQIRPYDGLRKITNLPAYPVSFNTDRTAIAAAPAGEDEKKVSLAEALRRRGQSFERIIQECHWRYKGLSLRESGQFEVREEVCWSDTKHGEGLVYVLKANTA